MRLARFIRENTEPILKEWETFARTLPMAGSMDVNELRDHAKEMLDVIAADLETPQTGDEQLAKSRGRLDSDERSRATAAQSHGSGRAESGFSIAQMVSEFRALRASVIRLWVEDNGRAPTTDLADMTRFNEAIDQAIAESITRYARSVAESKERFLAILGHDLRTPIGSIITSTRFMVETGELPEPHRTLVGGIGSSAQRMHRMVEDLLDFTRTRFGDSIPIVRVDTDLRRIMHDVVAEIAASHPDIVIRIEASGDLRGRWDPERLMQMLTNLLTNAVQHGSRGAPIRVSASGDGDRALLVVHNEGPAIPEAEVEYLFAAMKQARDGVMRDRRRLGLGLYIVDKIVEAHGGTIDVRSSENEGTTFTISLPCDEEWIRA